MMMSHVPPWCSDGETVGSAHLEIWWGRQRCGWRLMLLMMLLLMELLMSAVVDNHLRMI
jgi:hypothetical protein